MPNLSIPYYSAKLWKYLGFENTLCSVRSCFCGFKVVPLHSREPGPNPDRLLSRDQIQAQQPLENMIFVSFSQSCFNFLSLKLAIIAIKTRHWALVQNYSLVVGVCCKALALAASAFATNTSVSTINLHQCSAADLNPYTHPYKEVNKSIYKQKNLILALQCPYNLSSYIVPSKMLPHRAKTQILWK